MARIRSPGYPNASLDQVIENVRKIHQQDRQHPVDRETAAKHLGFSGLSGASDRALSALLHFGLVEKVRKGELRVTDLALRAIHPTNGEEQRVALREAAFNPELFKELHERYPDAPPSRDTLSSYLSRSGFATAAIPAATKAYLETCSFLQQEMAYDFDVAHAILEPESAFDEQPLEREMLNVIPLPATPPPSATSNQSLRNPSSRSLEVNEINLEIRGSREAHIEGLLTFEGLADLEEKIAALKMILKPTKNPTSSNDGNGDDGGS